MCVDSGKATPPRLSWISRRSVSSVGTTACRRSASSSRLRRSAARCAASKLRVRKRLTVGPSSNAGWLAWLASLPNSYHGSPKMPPTQARLVRRAESRAARQHSHAERQQFSRGTQHRLVAGQCRQLHERHPARPRHFVALAQDRILRCKCKAHVEVLVPRLELARWDRVNVHVEDPGISEQRRELTDPGFLQHLAARRERGQLVARIDVPARLKPEPELLVQDQEQRVGLRIDHERARGEVSGRKVVPVERRRGARELVHASEEVPFAGVDGFVGREEGGEGSGEHGIPERRGSSVRCRGGSAGFARGPDRKSTRLNSSHSQRSYAVFCLKKKTSC